MGPLLDLVGSVGRYMRIVGTGNMLGFPIGKAAGQDFNATTGVPIDGTKGWGKGALFPNFLNGILYRNNGTNLSSTWIPLANGNATVRRFAGGVSALDGANPTPVVTGLATVVAATVTLDGTAAPGVGTSVLTVASTNYATGALAVYGWKPTSNADTTLIASAGTDAFEWLAVGT